jgi:hypothetical protein
MHHGVSNAASITLIHIYKKISKFQSFAPCFSKKYGQHIFIDSNVDNHPELINLVKFCFAIPAHNWNLKQTSLPSKERNRLSAASMEGNLTAI